VNRRRWVYPSDGSPSYEVDLTRKSRVPAVHFLHTTEAIGSDGQPIPAAKLRELNRQGKAFHVEEAKNIAQDAHNETERQKQVASKQRKAALVNAFHGHGHH